jgi:hypothetical protein
MGIGGRLEGHSVSAWMVVCRGCDGFRLPPLTILRKITKITHTQKLENTTVRRMNCRADSRSKPVSRIKRCWRKADSPRGNPPQAESVRLNMPLTFPDMGFGLGCMVEGCALFGMADCRSAPNPLHGTVIKTSHKCHVIVIIF